MIARYVRAFVLALKLTLRGQTIAPQHPQLEAWAREAARRVEAVCQAADADGLDEAARNAVLLHIDRRDISMETILATVKHHVTREYVKLLLDSTPHSALAIYASNLNDRYRVARLQDAVRSPGVTLAITALRDHLDAIPS